MRKYKKDKLVESVAEFEESKKEWFVVQYGKNSKTTHRAFLESWQYHVLKIFIDNKRIYEAERINTNDSNT